MVLKLLNLLVLKSKIYLLISNNDKEANKAKGVNKKLRHEEYLSVSFDKKAL